LWKAGYVLLHLAKSLFNCLSGTFSKARIHK
jgi:hypothetical protein